MTALFFASSIYVGPNRCRSFLLEKKFSIVLDTYVLGEQDHVEVSPFEARLPLRSPNAVFVEAKLRIER
jgi:hypothetical protein